MRYISEGRFGGPKTFKTGSVVGSYPKPMLVLSLDSGGLDVLPPRGYITPKGKLQLDSFYEDIEWTTPEELAPFTQKKTEELPRILAIDFSKYRIEAPSELYVPRARRDGYQAFVTALRSVTEGGCPWATVVVDPATGLSELIHQHIAAVNPKKIDDTMKWSVDIGYQVIKTQGALSTLKCHTVMLLHETAVFEAEGRDRTQSLKELRPMLPSKYARERIGGLFSQYFYQHMSMGKPVVQTQDDGYVRANLGARWPLGLATEVGPLFQDIYGKDLV